MIPQYIHTLSSSFTLWADHVLLKRGLAYVNKTGQFIHYNDARLPSGWNAWGSPDKQWVTNSAVTGATVPSGVFVNSSFLGRSNGLILDYENGRILTSGISSSATITGVYSTKEINVYPTNQDEESLIIEKTQENANQKVGTSINTRYLPPYSQKIPAVFVNVQTQENTPFALGGMDLTVNKVNLIVMTKQPYELDGVLGLFADTADEIFKEIPFDSYPYTEQGDVKSLYNYETLAAQSQEYYTIDEVKSSKATDSLRRSLGTQLYIGFVDIEVSKPRFPRNS
jgi:hypothetical protein